MIFNFNFFHIYLIHKNILGQNMKMSGIQIIKYQLVVLIIKENGLVFFFKEKN